MDEKLTAIKVATVAFFTALGSFLGWQGIMVVLWIGTMAIDYISGTVAAWASGEWSSAVAREGIKHKAGMILVVIVAVLADITLGIICSQLPVKITWPVLVLPLVLAWYILTELGSILENAVKMGAPIPQWLMQVLKVGLKVIDNKGENLAEPDHVAKLTDSPHHITTHISPP